MKNQTPKHQPQPKTDLQEILGNADTYRRYRGATLVEGALDVEQLARQERPRVLSAYAAFASMVFMARRIKEQAADIESLQRQVDALRATLDEWR